LQWPSPAPDPCPPPTLASLPLGPIYHFHYFNMYSSVTLCNHYPPISRTFSSSQRKLCTH
jgi:hypothetical protein